MCLRRAGSQTCCAPTVCVCVCVGTRWAMLGGAWSHSANGAAGTASESIRPHYSSCSATVLSFSPHASTLPSSPLPLDRPRSQPCVACNCPASLEHTSHPQRGRPAQLAALTLIDLAPMLTQTPGETFSEREVWMGVGVWRGWYGAVLANSWHKRGSVFGWGDSTNHHIKFLLCLQYW